MELINIELSAQFFTYMKVAVLCGVVLSFPYIIYELWKFIAPALYENEKRAVREGYNKTKITGDFSASEDFNGCPYCGSKDFVFCGRCGKLSCWNKEERITCGWCGITGDITTTTEKINVKSGGDV